MLAPRTASFAILPALENQPSSSSNGFNSVKAVLEMASSSGLSLVPEDQRDPKLASSLGVGDQILAALEYQSVGLDEPNGSSGSSGSSGSKGLEILLGLGGSATNDGGAGMAQALGVRLLDAHGDDLEPGGAALARLAHIDCENRDPRLKQVSVTAACDVRNPLCGPQGASHVFGRQKGGTPEDLMLLDDALAHYARIIKKDLGKDVADIPGAGAAGGLGAGCLAFLNATLKPGIELVLDAVNFDSALDDAVLVITGEGLLDDQTLMGKVAVGVAKRAAKKGLCCVAIGGGIDPAHAHALRNVFAEIESLSEKAGSVESAMQEPARWLENLVKDRIDVWLEKCPPR
jgi:glycerate kinase